MLKSQRVPVPIKGWNSITPIREMTHEYAKTLENHWFDQAGGMNRRPGQFPLSTTDIKPGSKVKEIFEHNNVNGTSKLFVWVDGDITEWTDPTWTVQDSTFTSRIRSSMMGNILVAGDGVNPAKKFNGTAWSAITTAPDVVGSSLIGNIFHTHKGRVYAAGDPSNRLTVFYSDTVAADGADDWGQSSGTDGGFLDVSGAIGEGDEITGLTSFQGMLVVFCKNHIIFYAGDDPNTAGNVVVNKVISGIGCISHDSIQGISNDVMFLSSYGFKSLSMVFAKGDAAARDTSIPINNAIVDKILSNEIVGSDVRATYSPQFGVYICRLSDSFVVAFHSLFNSWVNWPGILPQMHTSPSGVTYLADTHMHTLDSTKKADTIGSGVAVAIVTLWEPPPFRGGNPEIKARWKKFELIYEGESGDTIVFTSMPGFKDSEATAETVTLEVDNSVSAGNSMIWTGTATANPRAKWGGASSGPNWGGSNVFTGDSTIFVRGRSEFMNVRVINNNKTSFKLTAMEAYRVDGNLR